MKNQLILFAIITTKIEKLDISCQSNFGDDQFKMLIRRCNKLTEIDFVGTSITQDSVGTIVQSLSQTLVKLSGSGSFSFRKNLELASMPKLQVLSGSCTIDEKKNRIIDKMLPNMTADESVGGSIFGGLRFSIGVFGITEPYTHCNRYDYDVHGLVPNGFWEIKAKQRTYNGFSKLCKSCGVVCKCAN